MPDQTKGNIHIVPGTHGNYTLEIYNRGPLLAPLVRYAATADEFAVYLVLYVGQRDIPVTVSVARLEGL